MILLVSVASDRRLLIFRPGISWMAGRTVPTRVGRLVQRAKNAKVKGTSWSVCSQFR